MEWSNAKKFVIVLLIVLNAVLFGLNYRQRMESSLSASREKAIFEVLSRNGISLYTDLITENSSMSRLTVKLPAYDPQSVQTLYFNGEEATVSQTDTETIYRTKDRTLRLSGGEGVLEIPEGTGQIASFGSTSAQEAAEQLLQNGGRSTANFTLDSITAAEDGYLVSFYENYKNDPVFSNHIEMLVRECGIVRVTFSYGEITGYSGEKREICGCDEALLTFLRSLQDMEQENEQDSSVTIGRIELGYDYQEGDMLSEENSVNLVPCYRIYVTEWDEPFTIDAYTCEPIMQETA